MIHVPAAAARSTRSAAELASNQYNVFYMRSPDMPDDRILNFWQTRPIGEIICYNGTVNIAIMIIGYNFLSKREAF